MLDKPKACPLDKVYWNGSKNLNYLHFFFMFLRYFNEEMKHLTTSLFLKDTTSVLDIKCF